MTLSCHCWALYYRWMLNLSAWCSQSRHLSTESSYKGHCYRNCSPRERILKKVHGMVHISNSAYSTTKEAYYNTSYTQIDSVSALTSLFLKLSFLVIHVHTRTHTPTVSKPIILFILVVSFIIWVFVCLPTNLIIVAVSSCNADVIQSNISTYSTSNFTSEHYLKEKEG